MADKTPFELGAARTGIQKPGLKAKIDALVDEHDRQLSCSADGCSDEERSLAIRKDFVAKVWPRVEGDYKEMLALLLPLIEERLKASGLRGKVTGRVKSDQEGSITNTLARREREFKVLYKSFRDVFREMHDLVGVRIVLQSRDDLAKGAEFVEAEFGQLKDPAHISANRDVGSFWKVRFGAYESRNHRVGLKSRSTADPATADVQDALSRYEGVMFEVQLTYWSKMVYNILAHPTLYKKKFGNLSKQTEQLLDVLNADITSFDIRLEIFSDALRAEQTVISAQHGTPDQKQKLDKEREEILLKLAEYGSEVRSHVEELIKERVEELEATPSYPGRKLEYSRSQLEPQSEHIINDLREMHQEHMRELREDRRERHDDKLHERRLKVVQKLRTASNYRDGKDRNPRRTPGTCEWFTSHKSFKAWLASSTSSFLWLSARAGCGKSVLAKHLVDNVLPNSPSSRIVCYSFFKEDSEEQRSPRTALCNILHQIFDQRPALLAEPILERFERHGDSFLTSYRDLWDALVEVARQAEAPEITCVLDALDECTSEGRRLIATSLRDFYGPADAGDDEQDAAASPGNLKIFLTSRPDDDIQHDLRFLIATPRLHSTKPNRHLAIHLQGDDKDEVSQVEEEIKIVVRNVAQDLGDRLGLSETEEQAVLSALIRVPHRTYLWVALMHDHLGGFISMDTGALDHELRTIPTTVEEAYERILNNLSTHCDPTQMIKLLGILAAAYRPLSLEEIAIIWAIDSIQTADKWLESQLPPFAAEKIKPMSESQVKKRIRQHCGALVTITDGKISFLHQTVKEFLVSAQPTVDNFSTPSSAPTRFENGTQFHDAHSSTVLQTSTELKWKSSLNLEQCHYRLCIICAKYIGISRHQPSEPAERIHSNLPSLKYFSFPHASFHLLQSNLFATQDEEFRSISRYIKAPSSMGRSYDGMLLEQGSLPQACFVGAEQTVIKMLNDGVDVNYGVGLTPVLAAIMSNNTAILRHLLATAKVDINATALVRRTALHWAAELGYHVAVQLLLASEGVDVNAKDSNGFTPLLCAAIKGHIPVVELLLGDERVDVNAKDKRTYTPLLWAVLQGNTAVVELLLSNKRVDVNLEDESGCVPLFLATKEKKTAVVELLLANERVDVNAKNKYGCTPLLFAARCGYTAVVEFLLADKRVDLNARDENGCTPLLWAVVKGSTAIVELLLAAEGVDVNAKDGNGNTPLMFATTQGAAAIVELLIANELVDVNAKGNRGYTALDLAETREDKAIFELLMACPRTKLSSKIASAPTVLLAATKRARKNVGKLFRGSGRTDSVHASTSGRETPDTEQS